MHEHHFENMVKELKTRCLLHPEAGIDQVKDALQSCFKDTIAVFWGVDDVLSLDVDICWRSGLLTDTGFQKEKYNLTRKDAQAILERVDRYHDAEQGINWDVIRCHIDMYMEDTKK